MFPAPIASAASFDTELLRAVGAAMGTQPHTAALNPQPSAFTLQASDSAVTSDCLKTPQAAVFDRLVADGSALPRAL